METLDELLGGSGQGGQLQDFPQRYEQGAPADGISGQEALDYREQVGQQLQQGAQAHGVNLGGLLANPAARAASGGIAAMVVRQVQQRR
jgi:hypothetical protein